MSADSDKLAAKAEDALDHAWNFPGSAEADTNAAIAWALLAIYERMGSIFYVRDADRV